VSASPRLKKGVPVRDLRSKLPQALDAFAVLVEDRDARCGASRAGEFGEGPASAAALPVAHRGNSRPLDAGDHAG